MNRPPLRALFALCLVALLPAPATAQPAAKLTFNKGDRVVFMGGTFVEREAEFGYIEAALQARFPELGLVFRNLGYAADEVDVQPRPLNFATDHDLLTEAKADVIFLCYGMMESFRGEAGVERFTKGLQKLIDSYTGRKYNGKSPPRLVLVSPIAHERLGGELPDPTAHNMNLRLYMQAMRKVAQANKLPFADLYTPTLALMNEKGGEKLTINGIHPTRYGYWAAGQLLAEQLGGGRS